MRLDMDCVRDILLCVEANTGLRKFCQFIDTELDSAARFLGTTTEPFEYQKELSKKYDEEKLLYHVHYCVKADLLVSANHSDDYCIVICDLTPDGHSFLNNIREPKVWSTIKNVSSTVGSTSLSAIIQIASAVISEMIKSALPTLLIP